MSVRLLLAAVSMILLPGRAAAQGDRSLLMADSAWARAYATHDTTLALELFSPDLVVTNTAGELKDRTGEVADVRPAPGLSMHYFRTADVREREYGRVGVVMVALHLGRAPESQPSR